MKTSKQEIIINHSAKNIYQIVMDIEKYPEFIPWCTSVQIRTKSKKRIIADDVKSLMIIPGIGAKTAKRIIVELKDKFIKEDDEEFLRLDVSGVITDEMNDAFQVLQSLGYSHKQAQKAMKKVEISGGLSGELEDMIKQLLSNI